MWFVGFLYKAQMVPKKQWGFLYLRQLMPCIQQKYHNSELCCMTYTEWVCERERDSISFIDIHTLWPRLGKNLLCRRFASRDFPHVFYYVKADSGDKLHIKLLFLQKCPVYILFRKSDVILSFSDKQSHLVIEYVTIAYEPCSHLPHTYSF